jgi:hypothetical protein
MASKLTITDALSVEEFLTPTATKHVLIKERVATAMNFFSVDHAKIEGLFALIGVEGFDRVPALRWFTSWVVVDIEVGLIDGFTLTRVWRRQRLKADLLLCYSSVSWVARFGKLLTQDLFAVLITVFLDE